eukprot:COSAG06_NODE_13339_length_1266_cov_3.142125_2_plen_21_part_01
MHSPEQVREDAEVETEEAAAE